MVTERFGIFLIRLDPARGAETAKTRPCVVVSPDELNRAVATVIIAPMTAVLVKRLGSWILTPLKQSLIGLESCLRHDTSLPEGISG